jgi:hypothetical protein
MTMFDNAIFASFIPQILMILAYISCLIAPNFSKQTNEVEIDNATVQVVANKSTTDLFASTVSFSDFNFENDFTKPEIQELIPVTYTLEKVYSGKVNYISYKLKYDLFSRPPPFLMI